MIFICTSTFAFCVALLNVQRRVCFVVHFCLFFLLCSRRNALSLLKVWGSAREAGPALESLLKQLLVKFIKRLWFKSPLASVSISSVLLCFFSLLLCWRLSQCTVLFLKTLLHPLPLHLLLPSSSFYYIFVKPLFLFRQTFLRPCWSYFILCSSSCYIYLCLWSIIS